MLQVEATGRRRRRRRRRRRIYNCASIKSNLPLRCIIYRVAQKSVNLKHSLILTGMCRCKSASQFCRKASRYYEFRAVPWVQVVLPWIIQGQVTKLVPEAHASFPSVGQILVTLVLHQILDVQHFYVERKLKFCIPSPFNRYRMLTFILLHCNHTNI
jgi:hypothetical protein